jgi:DNA replication protein DnaC
MKTLTKSLHIFLTGGAGTWKTFTLTCIIQNILRYYTKQITNADPLKPKVMKLTYTRKTSFNNNGTTIHFALAILMKLN